MPYNDDPKSLKEEQERKDKLAREAAEEKKAAEAKQKREAEIRKQTVLSTRKVELRALDRQLKQKEGHLQSLATEVKRMNSLAQQRDQDNITPNKNSYSQNGASLSPNKTREIHSKITANKSKLATLEREQKQLETQTRAAEIAETKDDTLAQTITLERQALEKQQTATLVEAEKLKNEIRLLETELKEHKNKPKNRVETKGVELEAVILSTRAQIDEERRKLAKLESELKALEEKAQSVSAAEDNLDLADKQLVLTLAEKKTNLEKLVSRLRELAQQILTIKQKGQSKKSYTRETSGNLERELTKKKAEVNEIKKLITRLEAEEVSLSREIENHKRQNKIEARETAVRKRDQMVRDGLKKVKELDVKKLENEISTLRQEKKRLESEIENLERQK